MGYALFANRKIMYSNMIFYLQMQLNQLSEERMNNMIFTSNISDGELTDQEIFEDAGNIGLYTDYALNEDAYVNAKYGEYQFQDSNGVAITAGQYYYGRSNVTLEEEEAAEAYYRDILKKEYAEELIQKFEIEDHRLEQKISQIETKITVLQKNLEKIEEQEGKAIEAATPNYGGVA